MLVLDHSNKKIHQFYSVENINQLYRFRILIDGIRQIIDTVIRLIFQHRVLQYGSSVVFRLSATQMIDPWVVSATVYCLDSKHML